MKSLSLSLLATTILLTAAQTGCYIGEKPDDDDTTGDGDADTTDGETTGDGDTTTGDTTDGDTTTGDTTDGETTGDTTDGETTDGETTDGDTTDGDTTDGDTTDGGEMCDPLDVQNCESDAMTAEMDCIADCNGNDCAVQVCEIQCVQEGSTEAVDCYESIPECAAEVTRAECLGACAETHATCFEDANCDETAGCADDHATCIAAC